MGEMSEVRSNFPIFRVGEIVVMTRLGVRLGLLYRATQNRARVIAVPSRRAIKVRRAGLRSDDWYWAGFWRHRRRGEKPGAKLVVRRKS